MLSYNLDFNSCAIRDGFRKSSHIYIVNLLVSKRSKIRRVICALKQSYMASAGWED